MVRSLRGITFIDVLVGIALILVVFTGLFGALELSAKVVSASKAEAEASELVDSQMEYMRSLPYVNVGVVNGIPSGVLLPSTTITQNGVAYTVTMSVQYLVQGGQTTPIKVITVTAAWQSVTGVRSVSATSWAAPGS